MNEEIIIIDALAANHADGIDHIPTEEVSLDLDRRTDR